MFSQSLLLGKRSFQGGVLCPCQGTPSTSSEGQQSCSWTSKASLQARRMYFIISPCSMNHSSFFFRRLTALVQISQQHQLCTSWVFFKQEPWPWHDCPWPTKMDPCSLVSCYIWDWVVVRGRWWLYNRQCLQISTYATASVWSPNVPSLRSLCWRF